MEQKIDELLRQLHKFLFADSEQVVNELRIYLMDDSLNESDLAFITSKVFNSHDSFLEFLRVNAQLADKLLASVKKKLYELLIEFLKARPREVSGYLPQIRETCLLSFRSDTNSLVKESALQLLIKVIENFEKPGSNDIEAIIRPRDLLIMMLDEIKLRRPSASVKGALWTLVGLLHEKYGLNDFRIESQDVMFLQLQEQMNSEKPEIKAIQGMMKGFQHSLTGGDAQESCTLDDDQMNALFTLLKTAIQPIQDMNNKGVIKAGMKLLGAHIGLFKRQVTNKAIELVTLAMQLSVHDNMEVRDCASELLGKIMGLVADSLTLESMQHRDIFQQIQRQFQDILDNPNHMNVQLIATIKAVGIFSKAILTFKGEDELWRYLEKLVDVSESKIIKEFEQQEDPKNDYKNFKQILKKQKQLLSFIESYSFILANLHSHAPSEAFLLHFYKVCSIGVRHHRKLYPKYRDRLYEALAHFTMSLAQHKTAFIQWSKKFVRSSLTETLKIPDSVVFGGESPFDSLQDAVQFWRDTLSKDHIWTEFTCGHIYDELVQRILEDIDQLNLTYKVEKLGRNQQQSNQAIVLAQEEQKESASIEDTDQSAVVIQYVANNNTDQQYLVRLSNFAEMFLLECKDTWFLRWLPSFCTTIVKKASQTPRISKLYSLLKTAMVIAQRHRYFQVQGDDQQFKGEKLTTYNMLLTFFKELLGKQEEYQDELLTSCLDLLLHVPVELLYSKRNNNVQDNIYLWKGVMLKALSVGNTKSNHLAMNSVTMLEHWFNLLPMNVTVELYRDVLPRLSDFLHIEEGSKREKKGTLDENQFQEMLKSGNDNIVIERKHIATKVLDLLGKIGGHAHQIINNEQTRSHEKENFIKWDPEKRLKFTVPLYTTKVDIYLDACLPKLVDLASNSHDKETRLAACEFLHSLLIYMIGKNATKPNLAKRCAAAELGQEEIAPFAKIYAKLFPVVIKLASETEQIVRILFQPLIFQIVRWFSQSRIYEHPEVESLLDALIEGASSRNNSALREMCSNAVAEFAKWSLKQMSDKDIKENPNNIKSLIRRIESNANHPDPFKRLSAVLCFNKIFTIITDFDPLIDRFCLEIAHCVLGSLKMCHNSLEFSQEVIENCSKLLEKIQKVITRKAHILMQPNAKRSMHPHLFFFVNYLFEKFTSIETVSRRESMKLWEAIVKNLPPKNAENMPDNPAKWITEYYPASRVEKNIFTKLAQLSFKEQEEGADRDDVDMSGINQHNGTQTKGRVQKFQERQKMLDQISGQLECFEFIISRKFCTFSQLVQKTQVNQALWFSNIRSFIQDHVVPKFHKLLVSIHKSSEKVYVCNEDKESFTKSKILMITLLFKFLISLDDASLKAHLKEIETHDFTVLDFAIQIMLCPMIHQLQVLVEDQDLERQLRQQCEKVIVRIVTFKQISLFDTLQGRVLQQLKIINLDELTPKNVQAYPPKLLMQMCLGYLKLAAIDNTGEVRKYLVQKQKPLCAVVEEWLQGESPLELESSRVIVKFLTKLEIPNQTLCDWLTEKYEVYQKTSDLLLNYIADNWTHEKLNIGEYLITKAAEEGVSRKLLGVFLAILEVVNQKTPNYQNILLQVIPREWSRAQQEFDSAMNVVRIYSHITSHCKQILADNSNKAGAVFIDHICSISSLYLHDRFSVHLKKEVLSLIGLIYNMKTSKGELVSIRLSDSLHNLTKQFFPMKSRDLSKNSVQASNFNIIIEAFLNLFLLSKNLRVLRLLYPIIREPKTTFEPALQRALNLIIGQHLIVLKAQPFKSLVATFFDEFFNYETDRNVDDNLRWAIMNKVIMPILEQCSKEYLAEIMIEYTLHFESILKTPFIKKEIQEDPLRFYQLVKEKTHIFLIFEIFYRRLPAETIKVEVHKKLYGDDSPGNEITKSLIGLWNQVRKGPIEGFLAICGKDSLIETEFPRLNGVSEVQRLYHCAAYNCVCSVIVGTQTGEKIFNQYLFTPLAGAEESLWTSLIDTNIAYNFEVETNFTYIQLKQLDNSITQSTNEADIAQIKAQNLIEQYVNASFMGASERFNSAMVFETLPDKMSKPAANSTAAATDDKIQRLLKSKNSQSNNDEGEEEDLQREEREDVDKEQQLELDNVNQHACMKNIKRCINRMVELFNSSTWEQDRAHIPLFMQNLNHEIRREGVHINVKIFILKILINNPTLFAPYAAEWFEPVCKYITEKNNGGKGFHYFMRDLCTMIISWNYVPDETVGKNKILCTSVVNTLVKCAADKAKLIFNTNIQIVAALIHRWRKLIALGKGTLTKMISMPDSNQGANLWRMTGIQVLALAVSFDLPLLDDPETKIAGLHQSLHKFHLDDQKDSLLLSLMKIQENKKKQIIQAASETLGKILAKQPTLLPLCLHGLMINDKHERHDVLVNSLEKVSREYPELLLERRVFQKCMAFAKIMTGTMRAAVLKALERYLTVCRKLNRLDDIIQICVGLIADSEDIMADISDENQQAYLLLLTHLAKLNLDKGEELLRKVMPRLKQLFVPNKNDYSRGLFYDLMVFLYDQFATHRKDVKSALIRGLSDKSKVIRDKLIAFWSDPSRLALDPVQRIQQLMGEMYVKEEERIWLNNAVYLLMQISSQSSDYNRLIFENPLQDCKFTPLDVAQHNYYNAMANMQKSQPLTPLFSQQVMFQASQQVMAQKDSQLNTIPEVPAEVEDNNNDVEMIDTTARTAKKLPPVFKKPLNPFSASQMGSQSVVNISDSQAQGAGLIRATQIPIFTQSQSDPSSLIATTYMHHNSPPQFSDSISASFYEVNKIRQGPRGAQKRTQILKIQQQAQSSQGNDGDEGEYLAPLAKKKAKKHISAFFERNQFIYRPTSTQNESIRYVPQGSMPANLMKKEELKKKMTEQFLNRQVERMKQSVGLYRKYRDGELPDIQIHYQDMLLPLAALIKRDTTIATEVFVEVFNELYKGLNEKETRKSMGDGVKSILKQSIDFDYGCINCLHRVSMELLKVDGFTVGADVIMRTGQHSMSFQTALVLLEETIIHGSDLQEGDFLAAQNQGAVKRRRGDAGAQGQIKTIATKFSSVTETNRMYWFNMINLYELIANEDALQGIWSFLADDQGVIFKVPKKEEDGKLSQDQDQAVNLIKEAHMLRTKGSIQEGLLVLEQTLNDPKVATYLEDHIKLELQNKRLQSKAELLKWDEIAHDLSEGEYAQKQLKLIPYHHAECMIRAQLRDENYWKSLDAQVSMWQLDDISKAYLDKNFNYELAMIALTSKDFDRARFYIDKEAVELLTKWKNMTKLTQIAQHILVQKIQKIYEMKEFLGLVKNEGVVSRQELLPQILQSMRSWIQREPSSAFDQINVWDDILTARGLYLDLYNHRFGEQEMAQAMKGDRDLNDIRAILQVQCAKGTFKMGLYDSSDRFLKRALRIRKAANRDDANMKIVGPIIKLKSEQFKTEALNLDFESKTEKLQKIIAVYESKLTVCKDDDLKTQIKSLMLKQQLEKKMLNIILDQVKQEENIKALKQYEDGLNSYLGKTFASLEGIFHKVRSAAGYDDQMNKTLAKTYFKHAQFSDKLLRKIDGNSESTKLLLQRGLQKLGKSENELARSTIQNGLKALNLQYAKASDIIPRLLDVVSKYKEQVEGDFQAHSKDTPAWYFLRWINQIVAIVNRSESSVIMEKVKDIAKHYPQALYYPFKVIESNIEVNVLESDIKPTELFNMLRQYFGKYFKNLNSWVEALDCLVYPEHRIKYWFTILQDLISQSEQGGKLNGPRLQELTALLLQDVGEAKKPLVGEFIGSYNKKFAQKWGPQLKQAFSKVTNTKQLTQIIASLNQKVNETGTLGQGFEKLSTFSEWLDNLDNNNFYNPREYIEVPGQYEGLLSEPFIDKNVKIASVRKTILILGSIRRPKRLTVHGSNEKDYHLLVKGGEDLRLDQRVQQLFQIMNTIFNDDPTCMNRELYIKTFNVIPMTNRLGALEWVDNTEPMKNIVNREYMRMEKGRLDLNKSRALEERRKWLQNGIPGNAKKTNIAEQHLALLGLEEPRVVEAFNKHKDMMPWHLLRNGLENLCLTSAAFLAIKNQFIKSLATFSVASYLIGIGDRHLENFLVDTSDGEVLGIDFGIAFGSGIHLGIPELMPFRLTQQIEGVIAPHPLEGVYKQTMVHVMHALRKRKSLLLDTCEIFVKEPLLDWVKDAKAKRLEQGGVKKEEEMGSAMVSSMLSEYEGELQELSWYPRKKIEIVRYKLNGLNPVRILDRELKESKHDKRSYMGALQQAITGKEDSVRQKILKTKKRYLEVDEQIDCLIELSRDPNILGRTWIGWSPYV